MGATEFVRVSTKGQITLPKRLRERLGISSGDYLSVEHVGGDVLKVERSEAVTRFNKMCEPIRQEAKRHGLTKAKLMRYCKQVRRELYEEQAKGMGQGLAD
jgi:antitoxin PrlF